MTTSGQSIADRALAAKHTVAGQSLAKSVCKATTEEIMAPKRKHLDYLLHCTNEPNVSIPQLANLLIERTQNSSWVVVFKALVTVHNMMHFGNERFSQFLASSNCTFHLDSFYDRGNGMQGYGMSTYIRRYAKYLNQKAYSYRQMAFDFCRAKRGKEDGTFRSMNTEQLLKALPLLQTQFDALIEFEVTAGQMVNGIISAAFMLLFRDLIRLYACYNDGIINLLGRYFDMSKKNCREAFEIYKLFIARVDKVAQFLKVAENIGVDKGEIPDLAKAPSSLIEALEQHLLTLENPKKASAVGAGLSVNSGGHSVVEAPRVSLTVASVNAANVNSSLGMSLPASVPASGPVSISDADRRRILEEEAKMLEAIKQQSLKQSVPPARPAPPAASPAAVTPTYGAPLQSPQPFTSPLGPVATARTEFNPFDQIDAGFDLPPVPPSYDLFGLDQPGPTRTAPSGNGMPFTGDNGLLFPAASFLNPSPVMNASAKTDHNDLFGGQFSSGFNVSPNQLSPAPLVQTHLMPTNLTNPSAFRASSPSSPLGMTDGPKAPSAAEKSQKLITGNLDASLATIAGNLSIGTSEQYKRMDHSWNGATEKRMTGAAVAGSAWGQGSSSPPVRPANTRPLSLNMTGMQPLMMAAGSQYPPVMTGYPAAMTQPMMMMGSTGGPMPTSQGSVLFASQPVISAPPAAAPLLPNDPFGAL